MSAIKQRKRPSTKARPKLARPLKPPAEKAIFFQAEKAQRLGAPARFPRDIVIAPRPLSILSDSYLIPLVTAPSDRKVARKKTQTRSRATPPKAVKPAAPVSPEPVAIVAAPEPVTNVAAPTPAPLARAKVDVDRIILPRSAALTPYRKNGPIAVIAYWLRRSGKQFTGWFMVPKKKKPASELAQLRAENAMLRARLAMLEAR